MDFQSAVSYIHNLMKFGSKPGLDRVSRLISLVGNIQNNLKFIHIAGTSGKGSVASYCHNILMESGYKVGLFTSPYVTDFRERFIINGKMISQDEFCRLCEKLIPLVEQMNIEGEIITEFEFNTVLGLLWFYEQNCDIVCLEVGMGGRLDSTNIIPSPPVSVITKIGIDHTAFLGDTIEKIAFEKCGIIKSGSRVVSYPVQRDGALDVIKKICDEKGCSLCVGKLQDIYIKEISETKTVFKYNGEEYLLKMVGEHQIYNAVTAICAVNELVNEGFSIPVSAIKKGLSNTVCPARLEIISQNPLIIIDGAHNNDKIESLYNFVKKYKGKIISISGMLKDKDYDLAAKKIASLCKSVITVTPDNPRALKSDEFAKTVKKYCNDVVSKDNIKDAVDLSFIKMQKDDVLLCWGSLYIAGEVKKNICKKLKNKKI